MEKEKQPTNDREGLVNVLQRARQVVLCAHVSPDGDTIGSCLALRLALQRLGKEATVSCQDKVPNMLSFLPGADSILRPEKLNVAHPELALCVDVSDQRRLGSCIRVVEAAREGGIPVTICGSAVGNPANTLQYLQLGLRSFSVSPQNLIEVKKALMNAKIK